MKNYSPHAININLLNFLNNILHDNKLININSLPHHPHDSRNDKPVAQKLLFHTNYVYSGRHDKGRYVYEKYKSIFDNATSIIDVGADKGSLRQWLPAGTTYVTIGYGENMSLTYNLEHIPWPLESRAVDVALCSDVLEHLENIHGAFDELCRIASKYVIISLPNPYASFMRFLLRGKYMGRIKDMKFYGLTPEPEEDRHRWFFSPTDAREFIRYRCEKNCFSILQHDAEYEMPLDAPPEAHPLVRFFRRDLPVADLECGTMWWILERTKVCG
jgi:hypothetical protein